VLALARGLLWSGVGQGSPPRRASSRSSPRPGGPRHDGSTHVAGDHCDAGGPGGAGARGRSGAACGCGAGPLPVQGGGPADRDFVGTLRIVACTADPEGRLCLTGVLHGTASPRGGARIPVRERLFTSPATLHDPGHITHVLRLALALIALHPAGVRIRLAPITVDIEMLPGVGEEVAARLPPP
jgi:hypothetical protein